MSSTDQTIPDVITHEVMNLSAGLIPLVKEYLEGVSISDLAVRYNIAEDSISEFLNRKEVRTYISTQLNNLGWASTYKRLQLINRIIDEQLNIAEDNKIPLTAKDLVDVLKLMKEEVKEITTDQPEQDTSKAQYIQIINELRAD